MLSVANIRAQISSVIDALSKAAVAEIAKVVEDGMVVLRIEICQRDNEILKLKGSIDILSNELKAANGGQDRASILLTNNDQQGSDDGNDASNGNVLDKEFTHKDQSKVSTPEVQVKREPGEEEITKASDALAQQGAEQTRFERESGTWRASSMYNAAGLGPSDYLGLAESPQPGPSVPAGGGSTSRGGSSGAVQQNPAREQLGFSYYRNNYNPVRWRNIMSLMFKRGFACPYCGKNFTRRAHLERHKLIHTGEKPYVCEVCGRRFNQKSSVKEHMKIHQKGLQPKPQMQGTAERQQVPEEKLGTDTPQVENGSQPTVGDELPKDDTQLDTDVPVKSEPEVKVATQPPNPCPGGSQPAREAIGDPGEDIRVFDRVGELWMSGPHMKKNPGTSNGIMGKNMPSVPGPGSLHPAPREPLRSFHLSGKPYRNPSDNATSLPRYSSLGSFNEGAMSASFNCMPWQSMDPHWARRNPSFEPVKPKKCFVCHFCCKVFERSGHLERHVRIHTGEKPYGCQICGRCFNQKGSLKLHLKTHQTEQSIEMLEAQQQENNTKPLMNLGTSTSGSATLGEPISDSVYDASRGEQAVAVKLEPETDDVLPPGNAHGIADDANFLWTSIIEESGRSLSPLASTYSAHAASAVSHMVKDWLGPGSGPASETGGYGSPSKDVPLVKDNVDMEMMLQEQYAVMDTSQEGASTFEVPDLNDLEEGCSANVDKQNGFICLTCGTSYECWSNFQSHQCKDPS